jgi:hypothetical protein
VEENNMQNAPRVFLSHASEDKDRFVLDFAKQLRENGIDVWLDRWEMLPGDSLVDKIFEEGLKEADAIIIVLSEYSVDKPWVREELNASIMKRIKKGVKIIPVVIDDCEVPESLKSTLWVLIEDLSDYQDKLEKILAAIYEHTDKPPLGKPPAYIQSALVPIPSLNKIDNLVLKVSCERTIFEGEYFVDPVSTFLENEKWDIPEDELHDSLEILDQKGYIKIGRTMGSKFDTYKVTFYGIKEYATTYISDYDQIIEDVIVCIVNGNLEKNTEIAEETGRPIKLVDHVLDSLERQGHIKLSKYTGGGSDIFNISPSLKRLLH